MEVEPFIGDDQGVRVLTRLLHLFFGAAPWVRAPVIAPVTQTNELRYYFSISKLKNMLRFGEYNIVI